MGAKRQDPENLSFRPFKDLRKTLDSRGIGIPNKPAVLKKQSPLSDEELFHEAMKHVHEIREFREIPVKHARPDVLAKRPSSDAEAVRALKEIVTGRRPVSLPDTQEYVQWINRNFSADITDSLHKGRFSVQDCLDLHGLIVQEAEAEIERFIKESLRKGLRCIKIIHGRGLRSPKGPVLKSAVIKLLSGRYRRHVIAFVSARGCDGGLGALYVLLR